VCGISRTVATVAVGPSETIGRGAERLQLKRHRLGNCFSGREIARGRWGCGHQGMGWGLEAVAEAPNALLDGAIAGEAGIPRHRQR
jgi:hypothetical protein